MDAVLGLERHRGGAEGLRWRIAEGGGDEQFMDGAGVADGVGVALLVAMVRMGPQQMTSGT